MKNWCPEDAGRVFVGELGNSSSTHVFVDVVCATVDAGAAVDATWEEIIEVAVHVAAK